jgi:glycosyltransferase involved in cell wall biosynthesis
MSTSELLTKSQEIYPDNEERRKSLVENSYWEYRAEKIEAAIEDRLKLRYREIPTISVVITTIGSETLNRAIQSVLEQTLPVNEIIVVLDSDLEIKLPPDSRIVLLDKLQKLGANAARNLGISKTTSDVVCLLDDDDFWENDKVETQLKSVMNENPHGDWVSWHKIRTFNLTSEKLTKRYSDPRKTYDPNRNIYEYIFQRTKLFSGLGIIQTSTLMCPRDFLVRNPFDPEMKFHQDKVHMIQVAILYFNL